VARQVWCAFCRHGTIFIACRRGRGTSFIDGREIVPVQGGYGVLFAVMVQFLLSAGAIAVQGF